MHAVFVDRDRDAAVFDIPCATMLRAAVIVAESVPAVPEMEAHKAGWWHTAEMLERRARSDAKDAKTGRARSEQPKLPEQRKALEATDDN